MSDNGMFLKDFRLPFERCQGDKQHKSCDKKVWLVPNHPLTTDKQKCLSRWCLKHTIERGFCWNCGKPEQWRDWTCQQCHKQLTFALLPARQTVRALVEEILRKEAYSIPAKEVAIN